MPDSVTSIGERAFENCRSLTSFMLGKNLQEIGAGAFAGCSKKLQISIDSQNGEFLILDNILYNKSKTRIVMVLGEITNVIIPNTVTDISSAFSNCTTLLTVQFEENSQLKSIGSSAFYNCSKLISITIPDSVTSIGDDAFRGCSSLTSIMIPNSVTSIGNGAFRGCRSLTSITIPDSVTSIGQFAFLDCSSLKSAIFENTRGWEVLSTYFTSLRSSDLADASIAAKYLTSDYSDHLWVQR